MTSVEAIAATANPGRLTDAQVYALARQAGFDSASAIVVAAISRGESGNNPAAVGDVSLQTAVWGPSVGLMQIRSLNAERGTGGVRDATRLTDPAFNMRSAYALWTQSGFQPWSVFKSGAYRAHIPGATAAAQAVGENFNLNIPGIPNPGDVIDGASDAAQAATNAAKTVYHIGQRLLSPEFWKRVGIGVLGVLVLLIGLALILSNSGPVNDAKKAVTDAVT